jgi:hypothetical protein
MYAAVKPGRLKLKGKGTVTSSAKSKPIAISESTESNNEQSNNTSAQANSLSHSPTKQSSAGKRKAEDTINSDASKKIKQDITSSKDAAANVVVVPISDDQRTAAERAYELAQSKRQAALIAKNSQVSHRARIDAFNVKLSKLSEHHDSESRKRTSTSIQLSIVESRLNCNLNLNFG